MRLRSLLLGAFAGMFAAGATAWGTADAVAGERAATPVAAHVVVLGSADLRWSAVDPPSTPALWSLLSTSAAGSLSVKTSGTRTCPDDAWLTLGAGARASAYRDETTRCAATLPAIDTSGAGATVVAFSGFYRRNAGSNDAAHPGALADTLAAAGQCVAAASQAAALGAADHSGHVAQYRPDAMAAAGDPAFLTACPVALLAVAPDQVDATAARLETALPGAALVVVGLSEQGREPAHLHAALIHAAGYPAGWLTSASTRRAPFVQLIDIAPTVLALRGLGAPGSMIGQPWQAARSSVPDVATRVHDLAGLDIAARRQLAAVVPFYLPLALAVLAAGLLGWAVARRAAARRPAGGRAAPVATIVCTFVALLPASSFLAGLVDWWHARHPVTVLWLVTLACCAGCTAVAVALDAFVWKRRPLGPAAAAGCITAAVVGADLVTGAHLQIFTMAGYSPLVAGRFAGIGNVAFGVFAAGALLAAGGVADLARSPGRGAGRRAAAVAVLGTGVVLLDGAPPWGSDAGGVLALVPAFAVLGALVAGFRLSWARALAAAGAAVVTVSVFGLIDYARPAGDQTHLGRFVGELLHGRGWTTLHRKASADLGLLGHSVLTLLAPVGVLVAVWLVARPGRTLGPAFERVGLLRPTLVGVLVMGGVGAVVNDSGVAIPALAGLVVVPATMAVVVRAAGTAPTASPTEPPAGLLR